MITCKPLTGTRRKDGGIGWAKDKDSILAVENEIKFFEITWISQGNQDIAFLFFTCHLYIGEIMPFVLQISNILNLADCFPKVIYHALQFLMIPSLWFGGRGETGEHIIVQVP